MTIIETLAGNKLMLVAIGLLVFYIAFRVFGSKKVEKPYQQHLDKILNSDEYKVKGRFE